MQVRLISPDLKVGVLRRFLIILEVTYSPGVTARVSLWENAGASGFIPPPACRSRSYNDSAFALMPQGKRLVLVLSVQVLRNDLSVAAAQLEVLRCAALDDQPDFYIA